MVTMHKHKIIVIIIAVDVATFLLQTVDFQVTVYTAAHWTIIRLRCIRTLKSTQVEQLVNCVCLSLR